MARNANQVIAGVGLLYVAPIGTAEPTSATAALDPAYREVGYTDAGATISTEITTEAIEVAEELEPIGNATSSRTATLAFAMAQASRENLALALNRGIQANDATALEPPDAAEEKYVMGALRTDQGALWLFRKMKNTGSFELPRAKTGKTLISVTFTLFKPTGAKQFTVFPNASGLI